MALYQHILQTIGHTPVVSLSRYMQAQQLSACLMAKVEMFNPGGSIKDRVALAMVEDAERRGVLRPGGTIIEPTSGNTGIGLSVVGAVKGYHVILTMPDTMSVERRRLAAAYGTEIVLTPGAEGMQGAVACAERLQQTIPNSVILGQFSNPSNPAVHFSTTAEEVWQDTAGQLDVLVAGVGTGGTLSGLAERLKQLQPALHVVAVEPAESPVLSGGTAAPHPLQGIGANFVPQNYASQWVDEVVQVSGDEALTAARLLARTEGILAGISSGAALSAATVIARSRPAARILVILPDTGERYLSTELFAE